MIYTYRTKVRMGDTDSTGALYFANQLRFALEAFESFLEEQGFTLGQMLLPIVHTEADYAAPMRLWDEVKIELTCTRIGVSSFTIESRIGNYGTAQIVHVATDAKGEKQPITPALKALLEQLEPNSRACLAEAAASSSESGA